MPRETDWPSVALLAEHHAVFIGRRTASRAHEHHAVELGVCIDGDVEIASDRDRVTSRAGYLVGAGTRHRIVRAGVMLVAYADPVALDDAPAAGSIATLSRARAEAIRIAAMRWREHGFARTKAGPCVAAVLEQLRPTQRFGDTRVATARARLQREPTSARVDAVSRELGLSRSRLAALFGREVGVSMRTWRRWMRLRHALYAAFSGESLTAAAHAAGFADAAHFSRTCREMFGLSPRRFTRLDRTIVV